LTPRPRRPITPRHDRPLAHPQLLHRCPYRPRQIDPGRPPDPVDRRTERARDEGPGARQHGHRARARHHHQGPDGAPALHRARRPGIHPQPDRHPRPCRFRLRGQPLDARRRGLAVGGRRLPGGRGPDPGQCLPGPRRRPRDRHRAEQDRPAGGRARAGRRPDRGRDRHRRLGCGADLGQDRARHRRGARGRGPPPAAAQGRPRRTAQGDAGRLMVRRLSRRRRAGAHRRRGSAQGRPGADDLDRRGLRRRPGRRVHAQDDPDRRARPGRDRLSDSQHQAGPRHPRRRHHHPRAPGLRDPAARLPARPAGGFLRPVPGRQRRIREPARVHRQAVAERRQLLPRDGDLGRTRLRLSLRLPRALAPRGDPRANTRST